MQPPGDHADQTPFASCRITALAEPHSVRAQQDKVVRDGIYMIDIPLTTGQPDRGTYAYVYTGLTLSDPLVARELDVSDRPGKMISELPTEWSASETDRTLIRRSCRLFGMSLRHELFERAPYRLLRSPRPGP